MRYKNKLLNMLIYFGIYEQSKKLAGKMRATVDKCCFLNTLDYDKRRVFVETIDPVRYGAIYLALKRIMNDNIEGSFAEVGVWRGYTSNIIHTIAPGRMMYLFDTFEGFPAKDMEIVGVDSRFRNTNIETVKKNIVNLDNVTIVKGYFPDSAAELKDETYSFVMLDVDLYAPTMAALHFFYEKTTPRGYIFIHDYNSPESNWAVSKAANEFFKDKPESLIEIPDVGGSVIIRKM